MGREISLFADYHQAENSTTNFCGLILKLLYQENPASFAEVVTNLAGDGVDFLVGPIFQQQTKRVSSIPDLLIQQSAFSIFFETKLTDWFHDGQLKNHTEGFPKEGVNILFLLSNFESEAEQQKYDTQIEHGKANGVLIRAISFEQLLEQLREVRSSEQFKIQLDAFEEYLDRNGHLPKWKGLLDVALCGHSMDEINTGVYVCPDTGGAYSHKRARFFGPYDAKKVSRVFEIDAIVSIDVKCADAVVKWNNTDRPDNELAELAIQRLNGHPARMQENQRVALQIFLLSNESPTNFVKRSKGGMYQSKKYFHGVGDGCKNAAELAEKLRDQTWE